MRDVCPAGRDKNLTSNSASHVSLCSSVVEYQTVSQRVAGSILVCDSGFFLSIQLEEHFLSIKRAITITDMDNSKLNVL